MLNLLYVISGHCHITMPTYVEHSKLSCSMVRCTVHLLRQIRHQISLGHYKIAMLDAFTTFFQLWRKALSNIARQARSLMQNVSDSNVQPIEQRMLLDQRPRESRILSTRMQSSSLTVNVNNTSIRNVESTAVATQLRNLELQFWLTSHACVLPLALVGLHITCVLI